MIAALLAVTLRAPALPPAWSHWKYERSIHVAASVTTSLVIPATIYANAQASLNDLRVVDAAGRAVPFAIEIPPTEPDLSWIDADVVDTGFVSGRYSQAVADLGSGHERYGVLDIVTPLDSFATRVDVDASDDATTWRTVRVGAAIYDYRRDGLATNTLVTFPETTSRYVRVRVLDRDSAFPISGLRFASPPVAPERTHYRVRLSAPKRGAGGTTSYELDGLDDVPIDRIRVDATTPTYARNVELQIGDDGQSWQSAASGSIERTARRYDTFVDFSETQSTHWRLQIDDGSDDPLKGVRVDAYGAPRRLAFDASPAGTYRLLYGNPNANAPAYDFAQTHDLTGVIGGASLAAPQRNPGFERTVRPVPWSERNPWLLWAALAIAVAGIGSMALRTMGAKR